MGEMHNKLFFVITQVSESEYLTNPSVPLIASEVAIFLASGNMPYLRNKPSKVY